AGGFGGGRFSGVPRKPEDLVREILGDGVEARHVERTFEPGEKFALKVDTGGGLGSRVFGRRGSQVVDEEHAAEGAAIEAVPLHSAFLELSDAPIFRSARLQMSQQGGGDRVVVRLQGAVDCQSWGKGDGSDEVEGVLEMGWLVVKEEIDKEIRKSVEEATAEALKDDPCPADLLYADVYFNSPNLAIRGTSAEIEVKPKFELSDDLIQHYEQEKKLRGTA
ncbi:unnamed protein product, partial [Soboliphyme baturini]|uniref:Mre11_DNA_bind domain-containing protein n=1 Tax=Soboliphyme baturini TaxID=241478 RepID=A0A183J008_9BILA